MTTTKIKTRFKRKQNLPAKSNSKNNSKSNNKTKPAKLIPNNGNGNNSNGKLFLTPSEKIFADKWLIDRNGTKAYRVAYPHIKNDQTAASCASALLRKPKVEKYIQKQLDKLSATSRMTQEWVLKRYEMLADYCIDDFFNDDGEMKPFSEIPKDKLYAIGGFKQTKRTITTKDKELITNRIKEFKLPDKKSVLDSIRNQLGFEKNNQGGDRGQSGINIEKAVIQVNLVNDDGDKIG